MPSSAVASKDAMADHFSMRRRSAEDAMIRWKRSVVRLIIVLCAGLALSLGLGWFVTVSAQQSQAAQVQHNTIEIAETKQRVEDMAANDARVQIRMDEIDTKLAILSDRVSTLQGIGTGAITLLSVLNLAGIALQVRNKKPA